MARDPLFSRRSSRSSRHSSRPRKTCNAPDCHRERMSKSHDGETRNSKFCHRHCCSLSPGLGLCCAEKRSSDAFCHEHSTCVVEGCKSRIDQSSSSRRLCLQHKCHIQNCNNRVDAPSYNFCWEHDRAVFDSFRLTRILPVAVYPTPSPSPSPPPASPRLPVRQESVESVVATDEPLAVPHTSTTPSVKDEPRAPVQDAAVNAITPVPVAAPVDQTSEVKTEVTALGIGRDKTQTWKEEEGLPTFFSGVGVGICILLQIVYALVQLLLELVRGAKKGW
ncbi:hypothetical protein CCMA1212_010073 [Trichoderma ghanense]|uniref:Uncharacterized protein n=1 Tax=Trichoderma ghanense TaxID=65468 RepID=A0ABY2GQM6_9HYPO